MAADQDIMRHVPAAIEKRPSNFPEQERDEEEDGDDPRSKTPRKRRPNAKKAEMATVPSMDELPPRNLPIMFYVPYPNQTHHYIPIEQLPVKVLTELTRRFD
jgi:hypothetical protein